MHTQFCKSQPEFARFFTCKKVSVYCTRQKNLWCAHMRATNMGGLQLPSATQHAPVCFIHYVFDIWLNLFLGYLLNYITNVFLYVQRRFKFFPPQLTVVIIENFCIFLKSYLFTKSKNPSSNLLQSTYDKFLILKRFQKAANDPEKSIQKAAWGTLGGFYPATNERWTPEKINQ